MPYPDLTGGSRRGDSTFYADRLNAFMAGYASQIEATFRAGSPEPVFAGADSRLRKRRAGKSKMSMGIFMEACSGLGSGSRRSAAAAQDLLPAAKPTRSTPSATPPSLWNARSHDACGLPMGTAAVCTLRDRRLTSAFNFQVVDKTLACPVGLNSFLPEWATTNRTTRHSRIGRTMRGRGSFGISMPSHRHTRPPLPQEAGGRVIVGGRPV